MGVRAKLQNIIDGMSFQSDTVTAYLNLLTGEVIPITEEEISMVEGEDKLNWVTPEMIDIVRAVSKGISYIALPSRFEINNYNIMRRFADSIGDVAVTDRLYRALSGKGAFRYFKDSVSELGLEDKWYEYRYRIYEEIAIEWCKGNNIEYERG